MTTQARHMTKLQLLQRLARFSVEMGKDGYNVQVDMANHGVNNTNRNYIFVAVYRYKGENIGKFITEAIHMPIYKQEAENKIANLKERIKNESK